MEKKKYTTPELVVLGKVQEITQGHRRAFGFQDGHWRVYFHRQRDEVSGS